MKFRLLPALLLVTGLVHAAGNDPLPTAKPEDVGLSSARLDRLAQVLRADVDQGRMPGAVIAITRKGKLAYYESFGFIDKAAGTPMTKDAIFALASMTKPMTAVAALMLAERGELLLNDPIGNYLPALKDMKVATPTGTEPARRPPTLQDMMRHTAGVTYGNQGTTELHKRYPSGNVSDTMTGSQFLETLGKLPLHYQPGTMWDYSFGLEVTGLAVEAVTKQRLGDFLQARLFAPLGMVDSQFVVPAAKAARIAKPLPRDPESGVAPSFREPIKPWQFDCGGGCASGTALDYTRFALMLLNKGTLGGTRILSRETVEYMTADQLSADVNVDRLNNFAVSTSRGTVSVSASPSGGSPASRVYRARQASSSGAAHRARCSGSIRKRR
jgi:CubicO group peptidase (beta-lactamase class C family)